MSAVARVVRVGSCVLALSAASVVPADACSCIAIQPSCEAYWTTPVVFSGLVLDVTSSGVGRPMRVRVEQAWRGNVTGVIEMYTGSGGGDCGYTFHPGERYVIYAQDTGSRLSTSICSRTRRLTDASEDLEYFKSALQPAANGRIFGIAHHERQTLGPRHPASGYVVVLRGPRGEWKTNTDAEGRYEFRVPAGKYQIALVVSPTERAYGPRDVELVDVRGCASGYFTVVPAPKGDRLRAGTPSSPAR